MQLQIDAVLCSIDAQIPQGGLLYYNESKTRNFIPQNRQTPPASNKIASRPFHRSLLKDLAGTTIKRAALVQL
jgi:hypothetical protein